MKRHFIRSKIDNRDERLSYKIRDAQMRKIPYQIVVGDSERHNQTVTVREYGKETSVTLELVEFIKSLNNRIKSKN